MRFAALSCLRIEVKMAVQNSKRRVSRHRPGRRIMPSICLALCHTVHGVKRQSSSFNTRRIDQLYEDPHAGNVPFLLNYGDMTDSTN
jgi:GDPmannose 4,6-dehydratase